MKRRASPRPDATFRTALRGAAALALAILVVPLAVVVLAGLNAGDHLAFPPSGLSLRWIVAFFRSDTFLPAYVFSFSLGLAATAVSTLIGTAAALYLARSRSRLSRWLHGFFMAPVVLPGVVLGLSLYVFYVWSDLGLARSLPGLLIGHVIVTCPFVISTVAASLAGFDLSLEEAARSLGASAWTAFRTVTLPIVAPGVSAGSIFAFIISFGQFDVSLFLSTPDLQPLPIATYTSLRYAFEPIAAAAGIFAIILVVLSTVAASRLVDLQRVLGRSSESPATQERSS